MSEKENRSSLTKLKTIEAWKMEYLENVPRFAVALRMYVSERTLTRMYRQYGLPSPKRGSERKEFIREIGGDKKC